MFIGCYESHDPNGTAIFSGSKFSEVVNQMYLNNCTDFCYTSNSTFAGLYGWIWKRASIFYGHLAILSMFILVKYILTLQRIDIYLVFA